MMDVPSSLNQSTDQDHQFYNPTNSISDPTNSHTNNDIPAIAFVLPRGLSLGGVTSWAINMCIRLTKKGERSFIIEHATNDGKLNFDLPFHSRIPLPESILLPDMPQLDDYTIKEYLTAYRTVLPGIIIPNWSVGTYAACALLTQDHFESIRVIGIAHTDSDEYYSWLEHYEPIIHRFVAVSSQIAEKIADRMPHRQRDITIKPYAVELPPLGQRHYASPHTPLRLVYAGRLEERQKRISDLVVLAEKLTQLGVNFSLKIIGTGNDENHLKLQFTSLPSNIRQRIQIEGNVSPTEIQKLWKKTDVCVLVSEYEGMSISMLEAMASGCVPVVTRVSGAMDIIEHGKNGFLVGVSYMTAMAHYIQILDQHRDLLAQMGTAARAAVEPHNFENYLDWFLQMSNEVWSQPPRCWPADKPLLLPQHTPNLAELHKTVLHNISGYDLAQYVRARRLIQAIGFKIAMIPGLEWLHRFRSLGRKLLGG